jgi:hypothetical protein
MWGKLFMKLIRDVTGLILLLAGLGFLLAWMIGFIVNPAYGHDLHLGDLITQSQVYLNPCHDGTYIAATKETGCFLIYPDSHGLAQDSRLHYTPVSRDTNGACKCPGGNEK